MRSWPWVAVHKNIGLAATVFPIWMLHFGARVDVQMSNKDNRQFTFGPSFPPNTTLLLLPLFINAPFCIWRAWTPCVGYPKCEGVQSEFLSSEGC